MTNQANLLKRSDLLSFKPGKVFQEKYHILSADGNSDADLAVPLGEGGSGAVFLAEQELGPGIAVKRALKFFVYRDDIAEMTKHQASGPVSATQFQDELLNLSTFNHENILKIIEAGIADLHAGTAIPYLVTEFVEGPTLKKVIDDGLLNAILHDDMAFAVELILQLCKGVTHLHSRNFFHCDIAPKNIFMKGDYPDVQLVLGDLGIGRTKLAKSEARVFVIGTKAYCPEKVQAVMHSEISLDEFLALQPEWDIYALAKTALELIDTIREDSVRRPWLDALRSRLRDVTRDGGQTTAKGLGENVEWLRPMQQTIAGVQELTESYPSHRRTLMPVEAVTTSHRIRRITNHPAMLRLTQVPQLVMASTLFPGATHTRYEHCLGTYQAVRRYLLALLDDENFLAAFSPANIECCLVCALLSGITRFPFSTIVHEIKSGSGGLFASFSRSSLLKELLESNDFKDDKGLTLGQVIGEYFPRVNGQQVPSLITGDTHMLRSVPERFIHFLLNSSIDARVVDYLRRDSLHLGLSTGHEFDLGDLLPHVVFDRGRLLLRTSGMAAVEQIISLRYWLFNRIYWNRPNRAIIAMIRHVLYMLATILGRDFDAELRSKVLQSNEESLLLFFEKKAAESGNKGIQQVAQFLRRPRPQRFEEIHQCNRGEDDAISRQICDRLCMLSVPELEHLQGQLNEVVVEHLHSPCDSLQILIDVPVERGLLKVGDDLNVRTPNQVVVPLERLSGIVSGVRRGFLEQLQRVRVFLNPATFDGLTQSDRNELQVIIKAELETIA